MMPPFCNAQQGPGVVRDATGQIVPKKIINPCLDSIDRQNLHRELMFNQKMYVKSRIYSVRCNLQFF